MPTVLPAVLPVVLPAVVVASLHFSLPQETAYQFVNRLEQLKARCRAALDGYQGELNSCSIDIDHFLGLLDASLHAGIIVFEETGLTMITADVI